MQDLGFLLVTVVWVIYDAAGSFVRAERSEDSNVVARAIRPRRSLPKQSRDARQSSARVAGELS